MHAVAFTCGDSGYKIQLCAFPMGADWNVSIAGGEVPHIGAVALATPYRKEDGTFGASTSVLTALTHKEDLLARSAAERLAKQLGHTVLVSCGIHVDGISTDGISAFATLVEDAVSQLSRAIPLWKEQS